MHARCLVLIGCTCHQHEERMLHILTSGSGKKIGKVS